MSPELAQVSLKLTQADDPASLSSTQFSSRQHYLKWSDRAPIGLIGSGLLEGVLNLKADVEISSLRTDPFSKE